MKRLAPALAAIALASCADPTFEVQVPFALVFVTPNDGSVVDERSSAGLSVLAAFNAPVDPGTIAGVRLTQEGVGVGEGAELVGENEVRVRHGALAPGDYVFALPGSVTSTEGDPLPYDVHVRFTVAAP